MVVLFCKTLPQLWEIFLFRREMNEPMMAIRGLSQLMTPTELYMSLKFFSR